ncbi:MAG: hypothetical protein DSY76_06950 [Bacteroidetes bacterium]|nr:MAG: hypothetical protein DSY76_06950 [Bacteroidota bacterium]
MLTKEQIASIRINIRNRGVETIDLETEMVDHISTGVEDKMKLGASFRDAFKATMLEFGPYGMAKLQDMKYDTLRKKGFKRLLKKYLELLTPPKILASLSFSFILYTTFYYFPSNIAFKTVSISIFLLFLSSLVFLKIKNYKKKYSQIKSFDQLLSLIYIFFNAPFYEIFINSSPTNVLMKTLIVILPSLFFYSYFEVFSKLYKEIEVDYINSLSKCNY